MTQHSSYFPVIRPSPGDTAAAEAFFARLDEAVRAHPALSHPFLQRFARGKLTAEQLRLFAAQHYLYSRRFTRNLAAVVSNVPDEHARSLLVLNMYEEIGEPLRMRERMHLLLLEAGTVSGADLGRAMVELVRTDREGDLTALLIDKGLVSRAKVASIAEQNRRTMKDLTHPALFRRFMGAIGLTPEALESVEALPETDLFVLTYRDVCREGHWLEAMGAMGPGTECVVPSLYRYILDGIAASGHVQLADYIFWTIHVHCDDGHGRNIVEAMLPYAAMPEAQQLIERGAMRVLQARKRWFDGLNRLVFGVDRDLAMRRTGKFLAARPVPSGDEPDS